MNVYVVTWQVNCESKDLIGIYSSEDLAMVAAADKILSAAWEDEITVEAFTVDSQSDSAIIRRWVGYEGKWFPAPPRG